MLEGWVIIVTLQTWSNAVIGSKGVELQGGSSRHYIDISGELASALSSESKANAYLCEV